MNTDDPFFNDLCVFHHAPRVDGLLEAPQLFVIPKVTTTSAQYIPTLYVELDLGSITARISYRNQAEKLLVYLNE